MKRIYLSGPMTGIQDHNFPAFNAEAARLRALGYDIVNPVDINPDTTTPYDECLRNDLKALLDCDTIAMLDGWMDSNGAHLEMNVAHRVGIKVVEARTIVEPKAPEAWQAALLKAQTAMHSALCAGGDYGDEISDLALRGLLKDAVKEAEAVLKDWPPLHPQFGCVIARVTP